MSNSLRAGAAYFALIFALGFVLGTIRVLVLLPRVGETNAVLLEGPLILTASWFTCSFLITRYRVAPVFSKRLLMGASALILLLLAEFVLGVYGFSRSVGEHFAHYATMPGALGLAGQIVFGLFPIMQLLVGRRNG
ncbi:MAG: hypothetical protein AAF936_18125 [Pseudomonadota bacterium]